MELGDLKKVRRLGVLFPRAPESSCDVKKSFQTDTYMFDVTPLVDLDEALGRCDHVSSIIRGLFEPTGTWRHIVMYVSPT